MLIKKADTSVAVNNLIANRWSPRAFDADKAVSQQSILSMLEASRWAPSCFNDQPWRYVVFNKSIEPSAWETALLTLAEKNQSWAKNAPVLILVIAADNFGHNGNPNRWSQYDTGAATLNLVLQAESLGLVTHQMGGFDSEKILSECGVPEGFTAMSIVAVGYQAEENILSGDLKESETADRTRNKLSGIVFESMWGKGINKT